ncbi:uncharacterized protein LOC111263110 [Varroa jacobsoni]|uniref:uncharacterized protein LOC111263110 n=1 Tax=Varroa jacobsoni TaxID=62625 RepID=UPI000BF4DEAD|nr:uncharacterized protein LOC111263110 [Varroa jacobsoni]
MCILSCEISTHDRMETPRNSRVKTHHELLHSRDFQCFCCLHVRTGTIALGLLHVMMQMAIVAVIATALLNPELLNDGNASKETLVETIDLDQTRIDVHQTTLKQLSATMRTTRQGLYYELLQSTFFGFASMMLMYGAIWGQPSYLMPFFVIMCFDFANAMLRLVGSFAERHVPAHAGDPSSGFYVMMTVILRAYLLNMVWSCYKFLRLRQELLRNPPATIVSQPPTVPRPAHGSNAEASVLLPDYEATQKHPYTFYPAPPPPYATAVQMPGVDQLVAPPPSYQDIAGTSQQQLPQSQSQLQPQPLRVVVLPEATGVPLVVAATPAAGNHRAATGGEFEDGVGSAIIRAISADEAQAGDAVGETDSPQYSVLANQETQPATGVSNAATASSKKKEDGKENAAKAGKHNDTSE